MYTYVHADRNPIEKSSTARRKIRKYKRHPTFSNLKTMLRKKIHRLCVPQRRGLSSDSHRSIASKEVIKIKFGLICRAW